MIFDFIALFSIIFYVWCIFKLWQGLNRLKPGKNKKQFSVSIIVAMKNEMHCARRCLDALIRQNYPADLLEIIIVDDGSTDGTPGILAEYERKYPFVHVVRSAQDHAGKKTALNLGIQNSQGEILIFTDADCVPQPGWASAIIQNFQPETGIVVGFSPVLDPSNSLLGRALRLDSLASGIVAAGAIGNNSAITCTGRNLAYRRAVYEQVNGFQKIVRSVSGDDDLFLQLAHKETDWRINFALEVESIVPSYQSKRIIELFRQKRRHLSAGKFYSLNLQIGYFLFHAANLFLFFYLLMSLFFKIPTTFALLTFSAKLIVDFLILLKGNKKFHQTGNLKYFLTWEVFFQWYNVFIGPAAWVGKIKWK
jgi:cellulose synthase/poly-beta-1,6-N-acetylglucosamine synthase-like glycosyltransferase